MKRISILFIAIALAFGTALCACKNPAPTEPSPEPSVSVERDVVSEVYSKENAAVIVARTSEALPLTQGYVITGQLENRLNGLEIYRYVLKADFAANRAAFSLSQNGNDLFTAYFSGTDFLVPDGAGNFRTLTDVLAEYDLSFLADVLNGCEPKNLFPSLTTLLSVGFANDALGAKTATGYSVTLRRDFSGVGNNIAQSADLYVELSGEAAATALLQNVLPEVNANDVYTAFLSLVTENTLSDFHGMISDPTLLAVLERIAAEIAGQPFGDLMDLYGDKTLPELLFQTDEESATAAFLAAAEGIWTNPLKDSLSLFLTPEQTENLLHFLNTVNFSFLGVAANFTFDESALPKSGVLTLGVRGENLDENQEILDAFQKEISLSFRCEHVKPEEIVLPSVLPSESAEESAKLAAEAALEDLFGGTYTITAGKKTFLLSVTAEENGLTGSLTQTSEGETPRNATFSLNQTGLTVSGLTESPIVLEGTVWTNFLAELAEDTGVSLNKEGLKTLLKGAIASATYEETKGAQVLTADFLNFSDEIVGMKPFLLECLNRTAGESLTALYALLTGADPAAVTEEEVSSYLTQTSVGDLMAEFLPQAYRAVAENVLPAFLPEWDQPFAELILSLTEGIAESGGTSDPAPSVTPSQTPQAPLTERWQAFLSEYGEKTPEDLLEGSGITVGNLRSAINLLIAPVAGLRLTATVEDGTVSFALTGGVKIVALVASFDGSAVLTPTPPAA